MQGGLILFSQSERDQPLAQIHSSVHTQSRGAVIQNLFWGRDKGRDVPTTPRAGSAKRQKELPRVTHESLRRKSQGDSALENQGRRWANRAMPTFTALFRLRSYQGLQEITYPLLQHYLKQTPYFVNPDFSGLQGSFPLGALGEPFGLWNFGDNTLLFINPFSGRTCKPGGLKHQVHIHQRHFNSLAASKLREPEPVLSCSTRIKPRPPAQHALTVLLPHCRHR